MSRSFRNFGSQFQSHVILRPQLHFEVAGRRIPVTFGSVEILPGNGFNGETIQKIKAHVMEVMGPGLQVDVLQVEKIPKQESGKLRRVISEIGKPAQ